MTFTAALFISAAISAFVAIYILRWRVIPGVRIFTLQLVMQVIWALGIAFETLLPDLSAKLLFRKMAWIGMLGVPFCWMIFVFRYTRRDGWLSKEIIAALFLVAALLWVGAATNESHYLFWSSVQLSSFAGTGVAYGRGPLFWVAVVYIYVLAFLACTELIWIAVRSPRLYRAQSATLILAAAVPLITSLMYVTRVSLVNDYTPLGFALTGLGISWSVFRYRLFNLVPVGRNRLLDSFPEGVLALDAQNRVIDANPVLLQVLGVNDGFLGKPVEDLFRASPRFSNLLREENLETGKIIHDALAACYYELTVSALEIVSGSPQGRLVVMRDVTQREKISRALSINEENLRQLFDANPFPVAIIGPDHSYIYQGNQALLDYLGMTHEEIIGMRAHDFLSDPQMRNTLKEELAQHGAIRDRQVEMRIRGGERRQVQFNLVPIEFYGESRYMIGLVDITAHAKIDDFERGQRILAEALRDTAGMITATLNQEEVLDRILESVSRVVNHDVANILLIDEDGIASVARTRGYQEHGIENPFGKVYLNVENTPALRDMAHNRQPMMIRDISEIPGWIKIEGQAWIRSHVGAPIFTQDGPAGFINLDSPIPGFFSQRDADQLQIFADQAGIAIQNARLYSRIQKAAREAEVLQSIAQAVSSSLDFDLVIRRIFDVIARLLPSDSAGVLLIDGDDMVIKYFRGIEKSEGMLGVRLKLANSPNEQALKERRPVNFPDVQAYFPIYRQSPHNMIRSTLIIPLFAGGQVIGFLSLDSWVLDHFDSEDERLAVAFSSAIAVALENARLYDESQRRLKEQSILNEVSRAISSHLDLDLMLELVWQQVSRFVDAGNFIIAGFDRGKSHWSILYCRVNNQASDQEIGDTKGISAYIGETGRPVFLRTRDEVDLFERITGRELPFTMVRSIIAVPLKVSDGVIGMMGVLGMDRDHTYGLEDFELFTSISSQVAISLENARLFEETRRRAGELEILNRVGLAITSGLDLQQILIALFDQCRLVMPTDTFSVALYDAETGMIQFPIFYDAGIYREIPELSVKEKQGFTGWILREGQTLFLPDLSLPGMEEKYQIIRTGGVRTQSIIGVPMFLRGQIMGVISVQSPQINAYTQEQVHLLETIATQAAIAIDNARLYNEAQIHARIDFLTGLLNRRELFARSEEEFERARRYRHGLAMMMVDIDRFKLVNDNFGHQVGDRLLSAMADIFKKGLRLVDVVGRYGGEEILIMMPETELAEALVAAERLRQAVEDMRLDADGEWISITVSIGVAVMSRARGFTLEMMISRADQALFQAKAAGRNRVCAFEEPPIT